jgi:hypothetical protein
MSNDPVIKLMAMGFVLSRVRLQWWPLVKKSLYQASVSCEQYQQDHIGAAVQSLNYFNFTMKPADANLPVNAFLVNKWHCSCHYTQPNSY